MSIEENLIARISPTDKINNLEKELRATKDQLNNYEARIHDLTLENSTNLKKIIHDLSNPLQILLMTIESAQDNSPKDLAATLERMKRAADNMAGIISANRKLKSSTQHSPVNLTIKVV